MTMKIDPIIHEPELTTLLDAYTVEFPTDGEIQTTIDSLQIHVPRRRRTLADMYEDLMVLLHRVQQEAACFHPLYWLGNIAFFGIGAVATVLHDVNFYLMIAVLSPIPFLLGLFELFKGREMGVLELELSCRFSPQQTLFARLIGIGVLNLFLVSGLAVFMSCFHSGLVVWKMLLYFITPYTLVSFVSFTVASKIRGGLVQTTLLSMWCVIGVALYDTPSAVTRLESVNALIYLAVAVTSAIAMTHQLKNFTRSAAHAINH